MGFVGDDQVKIGGGKDAQVFVLVRNALDGGDDDLGLIPVIAVFFKNDRLVIGFEVAVEGFLGLVFQLEAVDQEEHAAGVAAAQVKLDDAGGSERLAGAGGHLEQEAVPALPNRFLHGADGIQLVGAQELERVAGNTVIPLGGVVPARILLVDGVLGEDDVIGVDGFGDDHVRVRGEGLAGAQRLEGGEKGDAGGVALLPVPQVMQVAIGEDDMAHILGSGVLARLLLAGQGVLVLGFGFQHAYGEILLVHEEVVNGAMFDVLVIVTHVGQLHPGFELDVGLAPVGIDQVPAGLFEEVVDLDARFGFLLHCHPGRSKKIDV